jgi:hypothetical protein
MRKALVRCQPDGIGSLAAALTQCPAEVGRLPVTEKQQAECTIESDALFARKIPSISALAVIPHWAAISRSQPQNAGSSRIDVGGR